MGPKIVSRWGTQRPQRQIFKLGLRSKGACVSVWKGQNVAGPRLLRPEPMSKTSYLAFEGPIGTLTWALQIRFESPFVATLFIPIQIEIVDKSNTIIIVTF